MQYREPDNEAVRDRQREVDLDTAKAFARCFATDDGRRVLDWLRSRTLDVAYGPQEPDAVLRHMEGARALVILLMRTIDFGKRGGQ